MATEKQRARKKWHDIIGKGIFDKVKLGESLVNGAKDLLGKRLKINLMVLTNDPKKQSITLVFNVVSVEGDNGIADLIGYQLSTSHVRRVVRKAVKRIDDSFMLKAKDQTLFAVKPLLIARHRTNKSTAIAIRKKTRELLQQSFQKMSGEDVFSAAIGNRLQMDLKNELKKIYPIAVSEIRILQRR